MRPLSLRTGLILFITGITGVVGGSLYFGLGFGQGKAVLTSIGTGVLGLILAARAYTHTQWLPNRIRHPYDFAWWQVERVLITVLVLACFLLAGSAINRGILTHVIAAWLGRTAMAVLVLNAAICLWFLVSGIDRSPNP